MFQINFLEIDLSVTENLIPFLSIGGVFGILVGFLMIFYDLFEIEQNFGRSARITTCSWFILIVFGLQPGLTYFQLVNQQIIFFI